MRRSAVKRRKIHRGSFSHFIFSSEQLGCPNPLLSSTCCCGCSIITFHKNVQDSRISSYEFIVRDMQSMAFVRCGTCLDDVKYRSNCMALLTTSRVASRLRSDWKTLQFALTSKMCTKGRSSLCSHCSYLLAIIQCWRIGDHWRGCWLYEEGKQSQPYCRSHRRFAFDWIGLYDCEDGSSV
jgi:hypothetical protein